MKVLTGKEKLIVQGNEIDVDIQEFWAWNFSDLLNNTMRGAYAEFLVSKALGLDVSETRVDWGAYDIKYHNLCIEVKSSAYLQAWEQTKPSKIQFSIAPSRAWSSANGYENISMRHSDVYVFCLFTARMREKANLLNTDEWVFYVMPTKQIDEIFKGQKSVSLNALLKSMPQVCTFQNLQQAMDKLNGAI